MQQTSSAHRDVIRALSSPSFRTAVTAVRQHLWARLALRSCREVGRGVRVRGRVRVFNEGSITVGQRTRFDAVTVPTELACYQGGHLEIGQRVYINYGASISAHLLVRIDDDCTLGTYAILMDNDYHGVVDRHEPPPSAPIVLERNVWLGARVTVLKGVTIGHDSVIGAGSVVTKNIPPRSVAAGVPAHVLRHF